MADKEKEKVGSTEEPKYFLGAIKSPKDKRDFIYDARRMCMAPGADPLPETLDYRVDLPPIRDQGMQGSCVAQSASCMKEYHEHKDVNKLTCHMSPQFIYNHRDIYPEEGMYCRNVMDILVKYGTCRETVFTYGGDNTNKLPAQMPEAATNEAKNFTIKGYAAVQFTPGDNEGNLYNLRYALFKNGPCIIAFPVYNYSAEFWNQSGSQKMVGGHCVTIVGWTTSGFIIRNSWGPFWGQKGYSIYKFADFLVPKHWEIWTGVDAESPLVIKPDPKPDCNNNCTLM
jgi:hypothetical protein